MVFDHKWRWRERRRNGIFSVPRPLSISSPAVVKQLKKENKRENFNSSNRPAGEILQFKVKVDMRAVQHGPAGRAHYSRRDVGRRVRRYFNERMTIPSNRCFNEFKEITEIWKRGVGEFSCRRPWVGRAFLISFRLHLLLLLFSPFLPFACAATRWWDRESSSHFALARQIPAASSASRKGQKQKSAGSSLNAQDSSQVSCYRSISCVPTK